MDWGLTGKVANAGGKGPGTKDPIKKPPNPPMGDTEPLEVSEQEDCSLEQFEIPLLLCGNRL